ncbi:uncharacterized protein LOC107371420 isoform X2 [Tetranychus urticae]|uniref:uncharacterized protein LOC107371420 isoform X2 n=1 Tax=Tetranychus urticae TaxID=32264 RepID=UPI00077BB978|nr:uncharacterized protein LOC107371420 isoform X2 [Tetranychus urticae]
MPDEETSGHLDNTQSYYEMDEPKTKKRRKQSNPVRYGSGHHSMTITGVSSNTNGSSSEPGSGSSPEPESDSSNDINETASGSAKDFASLLSFKLHSVSCQQPNSVISPLPSPTPPPLEPPSPTGSPPSSSPKPSPPSTSSPSISTGNHSHHHQHHHHSSSSTPQTQVAISSASQSGQLNCGESKANSSGNVMPIAMFPYLFNVLPGSNGSNGSNNSGANHANGSSVSGNGTGVNLTSGAIHNGIGMAGLNAVNPVNVQKIFNPEAYCELCNKELCNKYFLKTHKANKHGIYTSDTIPSSSGPGTTTGSSTSTSGSGNAAQAAAVAVAFNTAAAYFQSTGMPTGSAQAQAAAAMQMQQLLQQASANSASGSNGPGTSGNGSNPTTPNIDTSNAAAMVALASRTVGMINMESYCDICQKQFCNKYFLKKHRSKIHNIHSSSSSLSGNAPLMLTGQGSGYHGSNDHSSVTSLANLTGLALTAGSSMDHQTCNRSISPSSSSGQSDSTGLIEAISLVSTKVPSRSPAMSPLSNDQQESMSVITNNSNIKSENCQSSSSLKVTTVTPVIRTSSSGNLVSTDRNGLTTQIIASSLASSSTSSSPSSSPATTITTVSTANCLPTNNSLTNSNANTNCETYCDICRTDLVNPIALQAHKTIMHSMAPQGSPSSSWTRDQWQAMMASLQAESFALLGRPINIPTGSAGENIIFTPEKLREMGVINADAFCEICKREFCNKYFLRTHKLNKHGIGTLDTASNCGSTKSNASGHIKGEDKSRSEREDKSLNGPREFMFGERQSISCPEDNTMSPRSSANEDSNQERRPSSLGSPTGLIFSTSSSHVTITPTTSTPFTDKMRASSASPITPSQSSVTLSAVNSSSNQGNGIALTLNSDSELICEICGKNFQSKSSLRAHRVNIHGIRMNTFNSSNCVISRTGSLSGDNCNSNRRSEENKSPESPRNCSTNATSNQVAAAAAYALNRSFGMEGIMSVKCTNLSSSGSGASSRPPGNCRNYCNICNKELCNKYFMKTHMMKMHNINIDEHPAEAAFTSTIGGVTCDICQKELCSKYFLKVHKQNTHGIGEDTPNMKDSARTGLTAVSLANSVGLMIPGASGLNALNQVVSLTSKATTTTTNSTSNALCSSSVAHSTGVTSKESESGLDCSSGLASDKENSVGIDPGDTGNRYFSHYTEVCPLCERRFKSIKWLKTHMANDHSDHILRPNGNGNHCSNSDLSTGLHSQFSYDLSRMCVMCGQICSDRIALQIHLLKDHKTSPEELASLTGSSLFGLTQLNDINSEATDLSSSVNKATNNSVHNSSNNNNNNNSNNSNTNNNDNNNINDDSNNNATANNGNSNSSNDIKTNSGQQCNRESNMSPLAGLDGQSTEDNPSTVTPSQRINGSMSPSSPPSASHETSSLPDTLINQLCNYEMEEADDDASFPSSPTGKGCINLSTSASAASACLNLLQQQQGQLSPHSLFPSSLGVPKSPSNSNYIIQTFLMTSQPDVTEKSSSSSNDYFVPSLVCLPVSQKIHEPVTVSFQLTPTENYVLR